MNEIWKSLKNVVEHGENYEVSNLGKVRSINRVNCYGRRITSKTKKSWAQRDGYHLIGISGDRKRKIYLLHRLVALAFLPNPENKPEVNHKNGNKSDNSVSNLEWSTRRENVQHAYDEKLIKKKDIGENHYLSKLTDESVREIRRLYLEKVCNQRELGEMYGVRQDTISDIVRFKTWKHVL